MTPEQLTAVRQWAHEYGRRWKAALRQAWMTGDYGGFAAYPLLQQVRNSYGPGWLVGFKLIEAEPEFMEAYRSKGE